MKSLFEGEQIFFAFVGWGVCLRLGEHGMDGWMSWPCL